MDADEMAGKSHYGYIKSKRPRGLCGGLGGGLRARKTDGMRGGKRTAERETARYASGRDDGRGTAGRKTGGKRMSS